MAPLLCTSAAIWSSDRLNAPLEEVLKTMRERAAKFNVEKVKQEDLASAGGAPDE
jgi:hypothetical protein